MNEGQREAIRELARRCAASGHDLRAAREELERVWWRERLAMAGGAVSRLAAQAGYGRAGALRALKRLGLRRRRHG